MSIEKKNLESIINLCSNIFSLIVSIIIGFFLSPYIIKHLGAEANGYTQLANNFINYASLITLALNSMAGRFMSIEYHKGNISEVKKYYSSLIVGNIILLIIMLIPAAVIVWNLEKLIIIENYVSDIKLLFGLVFLNFFVTQIYSIFNTSTYVTNKLFYRNIIHMVSYILKAFMLIAFFGFFEPKMYYVSLVGAILSLLSVPIYIIIKKKELPEITFKKEYFNIKYILKLVSSGIWNVINQCGTILMTGLDLLLSNLFINPYEMGLLATAKMIPNYIVQLGVMVNNNLSPNLTITYAISGKNEVLKNLRWGMKLSSVLMSIPIGVFSVFGSFFYSLWVPSLDSNKLLIVSILSCMTFIPFAGPQVLYNVYTTTNKLKLNSITVIIGGVINFIVVYILLKYTNLGIYAVAGISSLISIIRNLIITVPYTAKLLNLKWYEFYKDVGISCLCFICVLVTSLLVKYITSINGWLSLIISVAISCILSLAAETLLLLSKSEREAFINKILKRGIRHG